MNQPYAWLIFIAVLAVALLLAAKAKNKLADEPPANIMDVNAWELGPIYDGRNVSSGYSLQTVDEGWALDIPLAGAGSVHYVTVPTGSLTGKTKITMVCRLDMSEGVRLCPVKSPDAPSLLTLYFQRRGDNWSGAFQYETYRWFASFATQVDLTAGEYTIEARFWENWTAIMSSSRLTQPAAFADALANAGRIGFVLGGGDGLGHGVYATGPARLVVKSFKVE